MTTRLHLMLRTVELCLHSPIRLHSAQITLPMYMCRTFVTDREKDVSENFLKLNHRSYYSEGITVHWKKGISQYLISVTMSQEFSASTNLNVIQFQGQMALEISNRTACWPQTRLLLTYCLLSLSLLRSRGRRSRNFDADDDRDGSDGSSFTSHSEGAQFEYRPGHQVSSPRLFVIFFGPSTQI